VKKTRTALNGALKQEFQKDLELFKHFLRLVNNAGPIRNIELMWNENLEPTKPKHKNRIGTGDALIQLQPAETTNRNSPSTLFCDLVHGFGSQEEETCGKSDVPAQKRCRATGCSQVYACHVGLTDIAVPVICDGEYLGTLFSGQVLTQPPTPAGFRVVSGVLDGQPHINFDSLEAAYYNVPVVTQAQVAEMVGLLELFARYISNSWKRLQIIADTQRNQDRQLALDRKELAALLLSGEIADPEELQDLVRRAGLQRSPDRALVLQVSHDEANHEISRPLVQQLTLNRLSHSVEEFCQQLQNTLAVVLRPGEICVLTSHEVRNPSHERISLQEMADSLLGLVQAQWPGAARIGISELHRQPSEILQAYHEASAAVGSGSDSVSFFHHPSPQSNHPVKSLGRILRAILNGEDAAPATREFLAQAVPSDRSPGHVQQFRAALTWAIEHISLEVAAASGESPEIAGARQRTLAEALRAPTPFSAGDAFRRFVDLLSQHVVSTFSQRERKIVHGVSRFVEQHGVANVAIQDLAAALHLSSGHLSRVFRRTTGMTLENYLIVQRVELAKKTLLDPRLNVAEVAERCGFCSPAYFASVFKKHVHCTPRQYAGNPLRYANLPATSGATDSRRRHEPPRSFAP
jgi:AraC-like DNA-binding protein/ligand-binding sensor protein